MYLLDTNICIYIIKKKPVEVLSRFTKTSLGDIGISSITLKEFRRVPDLKIENWISKKNKKTTKRKRRLS